MAKNPVTQEVAARLKHVAEILSEVRHAAIATVHADGSPHISPVFAAIDTSLRVIWASSPKSLHSQNIARTQQVFIVLFDSIERGGGLFIRAAARQLQKDELPAGLQVFNTKRQMLQRDPLPLDHFTASAPQRLYCAEPQKLWVNVAERDAAGHILQDTRYEIEPNDLLINTLNTP